MPRFSCSDSVLPRAYLRPARLIRISDSHGRRDRQSRSPNSLESRFLYNLGRQAIMRLHQETELARGGDQLLQLSGLAELRLGNRGGHGEATDAGDWTQGKQTQPAQWDMEGEAVSRTAEGDVDLSERRRRSQWCRPCCSQTRSRLGHGAAHSATSKEGQRHRGGEGRKGRGEDCRSCKRGFLRRGILQHDCNTFAVVGVAGNKTSGPAL